MTGYHSPQVEVPVRLNTNESPFPPPSGWVENLARIATGTQWNRYPDRGAHELRRAIASRHGVDERNVFVANGSNEVIQLTLMAFAGSGRTVATFEPTYSMYAQIARVTGSTVVSGERRADFTLDPVEIERVMTRHQPAVTFLCNPNNPTGIIEPRQNLETLLAAASGLVVVDEAYAEFSEWSAMDMVDESRNLVVTRTFSKTLSLAALRVGYVVGPTWFIDAIEVASLPYHLDSFKQAATLSALDYESEMVQRVDAIKNERGRISSRLSELGCTVWPSGSNFILFRPQEDAKVVWQKLLDQGVLVRDCSSWAGLQGCLRVTVGTTEENSAFLGGMEVALSA
jgi:histidinol-phosphate aminotransferase